MGFQSEQPLHPPVRIRDDAHVNRNSMKIALLLIVLVAPSQKVRCQSQHTLNDIQKLSWLEGTWERINSKPGRSGVEEWRQSGDMLSGRGISLKGLDTVFVEKLRIVLREDKIYYVADVPENKKLVYFGITQLNDGGFTCENPDHDFPKKISYKLEGNRLTAVVSGDGKSIVYLFQKR
jgi:hypothetical protein